MSFKNTLIKSWEKITDEAPDRVYHMMHKEEKFGAKEFLTGLAVGSTLGFFASLLFAPQSGRETRAYLSDKTHEISQKAVDTIEDVKDKTGRIVDRGKKEFDATKQQGRDYSYEARERLSDTFERAADEVEPKPRI